MLAAPSAGNQNPGCLPIPLNSRCNSEPTRGGALFFLNAKALGCLDASEGLEIGIGSSIVGLDHGMANAITTTTPRSDIYAALFEQKRLTAGLSDQNGDGCRGSRGRFPARRSDDRAAARGSERALRRAAVP